MSLVAEIPLEKMFNPRSIALFGASESGRSVGSRVYANLLDGSFKGAVYPVNPKYDSLGDARCYRSVADLPDDVDLAVIATPARTIRDILRECADAGIGEAIVLSAGFREMGADGEAMEQALNDTARRHGIRFIGPNCVGLMRPWTDMNATFLKSMTPPGNLALVSQSGALCAAIADYAEPNHIGFSALVSLGNSANVDFGEVLDYLAADQQTEAVLLYVEGVRDARSFISSLRALTRIKPVVVLKAGRHQKGSTAATTHTGALIGSDDVFDAALERAGAVRVDTFGQLFAAAEILAARNRSTGQRLAIITNGGGAGVLAADRAGSLHVDLPPPSRDTVAVLDTILPPYWSRSNPVDILGDAKAETYAAAVSACLADPAFDGVLVVLIPQAVTPATDAARAVIGAIPKNNRKPVIACWMGETSIAEGRDLLSENGIPEFGTPESAVEAFSYLARHHRNRMLALETPGPLGEVSSPDIDGVRMIIQGALAEGRDMLNDVESKAVLRAFAVPVNTTLEASSAARAVVAAETLGFPVAIKIESPDITHKSDVGGVRINVMTGADVHIAWREIMAGAKAHAPDARIEGVTVEKMAAIEDGRELVIGVSRDPVFGPTILFGAGGRMVEVLRDSAVSLPPLNAILAGRLIERTRVSRLLGTFRNSPPADRQAVIDVLMRISDLACEFPEIVELDINPLIAGSNGVLAVDARIRIARSPARVGRHNHVAIAPYPRDLVREARLADGTGLTIRPIRPEDAQSEQEFVRGLSPQTKKFRFMHALNELTPSMLARFTQIDYGREMALVAIRETDGKAVQQGVARYTINADGRACEFAVVVGDGLRHMGVGTLLMEALMDAARAHGLSVIRGGVLSENLAMLDLMGDLGFSRRTDPDEPGVIIVERQL
jgi:acetyltransferase